jgi:hypothetical protein
VDAAKAVEHSQADLAFVPATAKTGLTTVLATPAWPELSLVAMGDRHLPVWAAVKRAARAAPPLAGGTWKDGSAAVGRSLAPRRPLLAKPSPWGLSLDKVLKTVSVEPPPLDVRQIWSDPETLD